MELQIRRHQVLHLESGRQEEIWNFPTLLPELILSPQNLINICPVNIPTALLEKVHWTAPSSGSFWKLMGPKNIAHDGSDPSCAIFFEKLALGVYQIWQCCRGSYEVFSRTFDALCRKSHLRTFSAFLSRKNLRTPSGKFLREKFCQPESFDFLCLWRSVVLQLTIMHFSLASVWWGHIHQELVPCPWDALPRTKKRPTSCLRRDWVLRTDQFGALCCMDFSVLGTGMS